MKSEWFEDDNEIAIKANGFVAKTCLFSAVGFSSLCILNLMGIFILDKVKFLIVSLLATIIVCVPFVLVSVLKLRARYVKYIVVFTMSLLVNLMYAFVSIHIVIGLIYPIMLSIVYVNKKILKFSVVLMTVMTLIAHAVAPIFTITFDEPLKDVRGSLLYGAFPRILLSMGMVFIAYMIISVTEDTIKSIEGHTTDIDRNRNVLKKILKETRKISFSSSMEHLEGNMVLCINSIVNYISNTSFKNTAIIGMRMTDLNYRYLNEKQESINEGIEIKNGCIKMNFEDESIKLPIYSEDEDNLIKIDDNYLLMTFYEDNVLSCFLILKAHIQENEYITNDLMSIFYNTLKLDIQNARLSEERVVAQTELIMSFAEISESKSRQTGKHIKRVSEYMRVFGEYICADEDECNDLSIASMLHDIGKLLIPSEILEKPGKLTDEEFAIIKKHTEYGGKLLEDIPSRIMQIARNISIYHHERWDGRGYAGIKGEDIDFYSRYVSVIDVFDALVSKRSYKDAWQLEDAYNEIVKNKGTQFAPDAVDLFVRCYDNLVDVYRKYPDDRI